jgi:hypothetical protein
MQSALSGQLMLRPALLAAPCIAVIALASPLGETLGWGGVKSPLVDVRTPGPVIRSLGWIGVLFANFGAPLLSHLY